MRSVTFSTASAGCSMAACKIPEGEGHGGYYCAITVPAAVVRSKCDGIFQKSAMYWCALCIICGYPAGC